MTPDEVLSHEPVVLTQEQRTSYFETGYLLLDRFIDEDWLERLWAVTRDFIEESRSLSASDKIFDLEPDHSADNPRLRRLVSPADRHPLYWEFASQGPIVDLAQDLLGPDIKFHHSKLNFKWAGGGEEVKWHQDIQFWPHTNYSPLTIGLYMNDVTDEMGPMGVVSGSHDGELFDLYNDRGQWAGAIAEQDLPRVALDKVAWLKGAAGSVTVHNCRSVHGSLPNNSSSMRPLLLNAYAAADALTLTPNPSQSRYSNQIVRGQPARWAHLDPRPVLIPPDWSGGYSSIFALQQEEEAAGAEG